MTWLPDVGNRTSNRCTATPPAGISSILTPGRSAPSSRSSTATPLTARAESLRTATSIGSTTPVAGTPPATSRRSIVRLPAVPSAAQSTSRSSTPPAVIRRSTSAISSAACQSFARKSLTSQSTFAAAAPDPNASSAAARAPRGSASLWEHGRRASSSRSRCTNAGATASRSRSKRGGGPSSAARANDDTRPSVKSCPPEAVASSPPIRSTTSRPRSKADVSPTRSPADMSPIE